MDTKVKTDDISANIIQNEVLIKTLRKFFGNENSGLMIIMDKVDWNSSKSIVFWMTMWRIWIEGRNWIHQFRSVFIHSGCHGDVTGNFLENYGSDAPSAVDSWSGDITLRAPFLPTCFGNFNILEAMCGHFTRQPRELSITANLSAPIF